MWVKTRSSSHLFFSKVPRPGIEEFIFGSNMFLKALDRLSSGELRTEFVKISGQDVFIYSESLAIVRLTMHLIRNGQDPFLFQFECDSQNIDESISKFVDENVKEYVDEGVTEFVDEEVKEYVDEGVNKFVDESINIDVNECVEDDVAINCNEDLVTEVDSGLVGCETDVTILEHSEVTVVPVSGLTVVRDSSSVSSQIPPSLAVLSLNTLATTSSADVFLSQWTCISSEGKTELWPPDNISSHCTMRDGISSN